MHVDQEDNSTHAYVYWAICSPLGDSGGRGYNKCSRVKNFCKPYNGIAHSHPSLSSNISVRKCVYVRFIRLYGSHVRIVSWFLY